jgi:hypothetical protein
MRSDRIPFRTGPLYGPYDSPFAGAPIAQAIANPDTLYAVYGDP